MRRELVKPESIPRLFTATRRDLPGEKRRMLATVFSMICRGVLPQHGELVKNAPRGRGRREKTQSSKLTLMTKSPIKSQDLARAPGVGKTRSIPRLFTATRRDLPGEKRRMLATVFSMICRGVLPQHGELVKNAPRGRGPRRVSQAMITPAMGVSSRTTVTHRINDFGDRSEIQEWRRRPLYEVKPGGFGEANAYEICAALRKTHEYHVVNKITGRRAEGGKFGRLRRAENFRDQLNNGRPAEDPETQWKIRTLELDPNCFYYHDAADLVDDERVGWMFDRDLAREGFGGFTKIPVGFWDSSLGVDDDARLAASWYLFCGIDEIRSPKTGEKLGYLTVSQRKTCSRLGMSRDTLRKAHRQLEAIGLFSFLGQIDPRDGRNTIQKIFYMPVRRLTHEHLRNERRRLHQAARQQHEDRKAIRRRMRMIRMAVEQAEREGRLQAGTADVIRRRDADWRLRIVLNRSKAILQARKALGVSVSPTKCQWARLAACKREWQAEIEARSNGKVSLAGVGIFVLAGEPGASPDARGITSRELWDGLRKSMKDSGADPTMIAALIPSLDL